MNAVFLVPQIGFNENELFSMKKVLEKNKVRCFIASFSRGTVIGKFGEIGKASQSFSELDAKDFDCVIIVGGENISALIEYPVIIEFLQQMLVKNKIVTLLCMAPALFLEKIPSLRSKKMTVFKSKNKWSIDTVKKDATYIDEKVVVDSNLITCANEEDASLAAEEIVKLAKK